ncbi:hypothetical protein [Edaphobacter aggregans]|nr:hypothetical protein [Edaphobacter aggregans]
MKKLFSGTSSVLRRALALLHRFVYGSEEMTTNPEHATLRLPDDVRQC